MIFDVWNTLQVYTKYDPLQQNQEQVLFFINWVIGFIREYILLAIIWHQNHDSYLSYIWRYDILWSKPFNFFTEVQCEKMMVKVYILHWHQCRNILRIHHLMHITIINQHWNVSVASIVSEDYKNTKTSNLTFWQYFCLWNFSDLHVYLKIVPCDLFRVLLLVLHVAPIYVFQSKKATS